ncbi:MAG: TIGR01212 family radical SAM protein [Deltaproteobacteria bacterium]|nr:TIGR01212 family radical SAM protein [Deltaproteobacteria bacterium]
MQITTKPYNALSDYMKARFGCKVFKVSLDAGLTCPNRDGSKGNGGCIYCSNASLKPKGAALKGIADQLAAGIDYIRIRHKAVKFIAYFQMNTGTYAPTEYLRGIFNEALISKDVAGISISTRPDCLSDATLDMLASLKGAGPLWLELGLQSANDRVLEALNRRHTVKEFEDAVHRARIRGIDVCAHVIIGLPGEDATDWLNTAQFLGGVKVWGVKFHQLQVLKGTALNEMYERGEVRLLELDEYASAIVDCIEALPPATVVHRLCGDAPLEHLVAPRWGVNKFIVMDRIRRFFVERGAYQGRTSPTFLERPVTRRLAPQAR